MATIANHLLIIDNPAIFKKPTSQTKTKKKIDTRISSRIRQGSSNTPYSSESPAPNRQNRTEQSRAEQGTHKAGQPHAQQQQPAADEALELAKEGGRSMKMPCPNPMENR